MPIGSQQFRDVLRLWPSGVSVVTTPGRRGPVAITVSSFTSLSLDPPLVLICIEKKANSHGAIARQGRFAVNILRDDQADLSDLAAGRRGPKRHAAIHGAHHRPRVTGAPVLEKSLAWIDCSVERMLDGGDHTIFIGRVEAAGTAPGKPLLWFDRDYARLAARRSAGRLRRAVARRLSARRRRGAGGRRRPD